MATNSYNAIVIGGGHNGLVAAAYLSKRGAGVLLLEARERTGGASDTMAPWPEAPDHKVTTLSYVMSLMPPRIVQDLQLERFGYKVFPMGPTYVPLPDGEALQLPDDPGLARERVGRFSKRDADRLGEWDEWIGELAGILGPMLMDVPPTLGSKRPGELLDQLRFLVRRRGVVSVRHVADITKLFTMSAADLLDEWFESDVVKAALSTDGIIGTWAGPCEPGTAYVLMHHKVGDLGDGQVGEWGYPEGGMGAVAAAIRASAESLGAEVRVGTPVERLLVEGGRVRGVATAGGEEFRAPLVVTACHPKITFLRQIDRAELPPDFVRDIENWRTRSGTVKVNLAVDRLPQFRADPGDDPQIQGASIMFAPSVGELERAFQDAREGRAAERPFSETCIPTVFDRTLAPEGRHTVSMFTQWVPHEWASEPHPEQLDAYADRLIAMHEEVAPGFTDSILHRQVIGPYEMEHEFNLIGGNIFHGELTTDQLFHMRPAAGYANYRTPIRGLYQCSSATHAGGGVTGIPAYNAIREITRDRKAAGRR